MDFSRFSLEGKVAVVTGGSRGIGRSAALALADAGAHVVLSSRKRGSRTGCRGDIGAGSYVTGETIVIDGGRVHGEPSCWLEKK